MSPIFECLQASPADYQKAIEAAKKAWEVWAEVMYLYRWDSRKLLREKGEEGAGGCRNGEGDGEGGGRGRRREGGGRGRRREGGGRWRRREGGGRGRRREGGGRGERRGQPRPPSSYM